VQLLLLVRQMLGCRLLMVCRWLKMLLLLLQLLLVDDKSTPLLLLPLTLQPLLLLVLHAASSPVLPPLLMLPQHTLLLLLTVAEPLLLRLRQLLPLRLLAVLLLLLPVLCQLHEQLAQLQAHLVSQGRVLVGAGASRPRTPGRSMACGWVTAEGGAGTSEQGRSTVGHDSVACVRSSACRSWVSLLALLLKCCCLHIRQGC
jgi:hypothetical protein